MTTAEAADPPIVPADDHGSGREGAARPGSSSALRTTSAVLGCLAILVLLSFYGLSRGEPNATWGEVWSAVWGTGPADGVLIEVLVREVRFPRLIIAVMAGCALGMAGVALQDSLRNPLADPYLLGVAQGAGFFVALQAIYPALVPPLPLTVLCLLGGSLSAVAVLVLSRNARDPVRVVLAGAMVTLFLGTLATVVILLAPQSAAAGLFGYFRFVIGSLAAVQWNDVGTVLPWFVAGVPMVVGSARMLNLLQLGDETAAALGLNPARARLWLIAVSMVLVTPFVAVIGPIGFVALFAPHMSRTLLASSDARLLLPVAGLVGATLLVAADAAGRLVFFPIETPAGIFTWVVVGPVAMVLVGRLGRRTS